MSHNEELLSFFQEQYRRARGSRRDIRVGDKLYTDLAIDSLLSSQLLIALEDRYNVQLVDDPRVWEVRTVQELLDLVRDVELQRQTVNQFESRA